MNQRRVHRRWLPIRLLVRLSIRRQSPLLFASGAFVALLFAACSSGGADGATPDAATSNGGPAAGGPSAEGRTEEFGMTERELATGIETAEQHIATCMTDAGFEYVPADVVSVRAAMDALGSLPGVSEEDFVAQYGYGISTGGLADRQATKLVGDRNISYYAELSEADQTAFDRALLGDDLEATFVFALDDEDFSSTGGCTREAVEQVFSTEQLSASYFNPIDARVENDPRYLAALEDWQDCMSESGFDYDDSNDAEDDIEERFEAVTDGEDPETLSGNALAALIELQGLERAVAQADIDCEEEFVVDVEDAIAFELTGVS